MISKTDQPKNPYQCPVEATMDVIGGKWKIIIIHLIPETRRFSELRRLIPQITQRMLTSQLPPKVEYSLTELDQSLEPILWVMHDWGETFINKN